MQEPHQQNPFTKLKQISLPQLSGRAKQAIYIGLFGNLLLFLVKLILGAYINSVAVIADGFHSLSDSFTTLLVFVGLWAAAKKADEHHPFGHGRSEYIGTLVLGILLVVAAIELAREALVNLDRWDDVEVDVSPWAVLIILATAAAKLWMFVFIAGLAREEGSRLIGADAIHHKVDAVTSLAVAGGLMAVAFGFPAMDAIIGLGVAAMVAWSGYKMAQGAATILLGEDISEERKQFIKERILEVEGAHNPHDVLVHDYGNLQTISVHVEIDPNLTLEKAHAITDEVVDKLRELVNGEITVHPDPLYEAEEV